MMKVINYPLKHPNFKFGVRLDIQPWLDNTLQDMKRWAKENKIKIWVDSLEIWFLTEADRTFFYLTWSE